MGLFFCEGMSNPTGIDKRAPWISWELEEKEKDFVLEKFQVLTESRGEVLWDSGIRNGFFHQMQIPDICGEHQDYRAVVRLWDQEGNLSAHTGQNRYVIAYHRFGTPLEKYKGMEGYCREICMAELKFGEDGKMLPVEL